MRLRAMVLVAVLGAAACGSGTAGEGTGTTAGDITTTAAAAPSTTTQSTTTTQAPTTSTTATGSPTTTAASTTTTAATTSSTSASTTTTTAATTTTTAAATTTTQAGTTVDVQIESFRFTPADVTIRVGSTVRWTLVSGTHTTEANDGSWDSGSMSAGDTFSRAFTTAGTYSYFCRFHPGMQGTVTVES